MKAYKLIAIVASFCLVGAVFVAAPPIYLHVKNGSEWVPVVVDYYGRPIIETDCVQSYTDFEFSDNSAPPNSVGAYYTLEGGIDMNDVHGVRTMWDFNMTEVHINSRVSATCPTPLNAIVLVNGKPAVNILLASGYNNFTSDGLPLTVTKHGVISVKTNSTHSCLSTPDDVVIRVSGTKACIPSAD